MFVGFAGRVARCVLDDATRCEVDPPATDLVIDNPVPLPTGFHRLPGVLHGYRVPAADLPGYRDPSKR